MSVQPWDVAHSRLETECRHLCTFSFALLSPEMGRKALLAKAMLTRRSHTHVLLRSGGCRVGRRCRLVLRQLRRLGQPCGNVCGCEMLWTVLLLVAECLASRKLAK